MIRRLAVIALLFFAATPCAATEVLEAGLFRIAHHPDDRPTAEASLDVLEDAVAEFAPRLPAGEEPVYVVIAHDITEFSRYAQSFGSLQVAGLARPADSLIVVKGPALRTGNDDYGGTLRHELVHILLHRNVDTELLPKWLNEGLCMSMANEYRWASLFQMTEMFVGNRIIEYRNLDLTFLTPGSEMQFGDAYAQGLSMTRYLRNKLGEDAFWDVVLNVRGGTTFADALETHGGMTVAEFWKKYQRSLWWVAIVGSLATGSVFGPVSLLVVVGWYRKRRQNQRTLDRWAVEEEHNVYTDDPDWEDTVDFWDEVIEDPDAWDDGDYWR